MDFTTVVHTRRSIRNYNEQPVAADDIRTLLEAAMAAPSAGNCRTWEFVVVDDRSLLEAFSKVSPYSGMAAKAAVGILVCGNLASERYPGFWVQDCSASAQNILLAATDLGLGAVWLGLYPDQERVKQTQALFKLPENVIPLAMISIGHHDQTPRREDRYEPPKIHRNSW